MATTIQNVNISEIASFFSNPMPETGAQESFRHNRARVYALAFWMTDSEVAAEELTQIVLQRAYLGVNERVNEPSPEWVDRILISVLREMMPLGQLSLRCPPISGARSVRGNMLRVHLERAVVQVPATERLIYLLHDGEGYRHARIARTLGISERQSLEGLHQARLRIRELIAEMQ